jgi:hypothetical protein
MISVKSGLLRLAGSLLALQVLLAPASAGSGGEWECSTADGLYEYFDGELKARQGDEHLKAVEISRANVFDVRSTCTNKAGQSFPTWEMLDVVVLRARPAGADQDYNYRPPRCSRPARTGTRVRFSRTVLGDHEDVVLAVAAGARCPRGSDSIGSIDTTMPGASTVSMSSRSSTPASRP